MNTFVVKTLLRAALGCVKRQSCQREREETTLAGGNKKGRRPVLKKTNLEIVTITPPSQMAIVHNFPSGG